MLSSFSSVTIKYSLFIFNLILVISGLVLFCLGIVVKGVYTEYERLLDDRYLSASSLLISSGILLFIFAFFGCCGAIKENRCMILMFSVLLSAVFILELATGITGWVLSDKADALLDRTLNVTMNEYVNSTDLRHFWSTMQKNLHCCGIHNYTDWYPVFHSDELLPLSCCDIPYDVKVFNCSASSGIFLHNLPCKEQIGVVVENNAVTICAAALSIIILQLLGIVFSCYLAKYISTSSYESV
uniref:Tetraspanin n=1 Tax=Panstrongylus lignarius TaxID=156445 RepID=A0A224XWC3_9HEMI